MASDGSTCVRVLLVIFNVLFLLGGLVLIIDGTVVKVNLHNNLNYFGNTEGVAIFTIVLGCVIFAISFLGCCGAWTKNSCMLITFSILMSIILVILVSAGIFTFVAGSKVREMAKNKLETDLKNFDTNNPSADVWNGIQENLKCCGISNYSDWSGNGKFGGTGSVPDSCCKNETSHCGVGQLKHPKDIYTEGCLNKIDAVLKGFMFVIGGIAVAVAILIFIGILLSSCLAHSVRGEYSTV